MMNQFYLEIFDIACRHSSPTKDDISNKEDIILEAIDRLPEGKRNFIRMLKPVYPDPDPDGVNSMRQNKMVSRVFHMGREKIKNNRKRIRRDIIKILIDLLPPEDTNS